MSSQNFTTTLLLDQPPQEVFEAINNVADWWQGEIKGHSHQLNDEFSYQMLEFHFSKQKVVEMIPDKKVCWLVTESNLSFTKKKDEWTGTKICFEISEENGKTKLEFSHLGLVPEFECYGDCSNGWTELIQKSLFSYITTGKGVDVF